MISPIERSISKYAVVNRHDVVTDHVFSESDLLCLPKGSYHRGVHIFIELFGGKFMLQNFNGRLTTPVFGHPILYESRDAAAKRLIKAALGITPTMEDLLKVSTLQPCEESENEIIHFYNYLMDPKEEILELSGGVKDVIICPFDTVVDDVYEDMQNGGKKYSPIFFVLMNIYLTLHKS